MDLISQFRTHLKSERLSKNTVKNYCSDLSTYVDYLKVQNNYFSILTLPFVFKKELISGYKRNLLEKQFPITTVNRRLSSLRKFLEYATSHQLVDRNFIDKISNIESSSQFKESLEYPIGQSINETHVKRFRSYLVAQGNSSNTVKGYISDIKYYLGIRNASSTSPASSTRRLYSLKKFIGWKNKTYYPTLLPTAEDKSSHKQGIAFYLLALIVLVLLFSTLSLLFINDRFRGLHDLTFFRPNNEISILMDSFKKSSLFSKRTYSFEVFDAANKIGPDDSMGNILTRLLSSPKPIDPTEVGTNINTTNVLGASTTYFELLLDKLFSNKIICPVASCQ